MTASPRITPATAPYDDAIQAQFDRLMPPGIDPLVLFRTLANDTRLFSRFMGAGLLDKGHLSLRERELAIDRTCAQTGCAYEWGVHIAFFKDQVSLTDEEIDALATKTPEAGPWNDHEVLILKLMDALHQTSRVEDALWVELRSEFEEMQLLELIMLAGFYHTVAYLCNGLDLPLESYGAPLEKA
ncbi:MAG: carboxymuconolactone decarboxylase family protein [Parvibaculaceae bacterium]|nr:carboxymuconolactone decarboxylase family protein [Parvibaculaceae bacterium]HBM88840.1 carboxymuconolactone decarboxylase family protein [Rhodobiaceae bacterium]